jgi:hypoxanthine phosphoribosyltransferase
MLVMSINSPEAGPQLEEISSIVENADEKVESVRAAEKNQVVSIRLTRENIRDMPEEIFDLTKMEKYNTHEIQNVAEGTVNLINLVVSEKKDTVFFLDKSARPLGFLFMKTWDELYPEKQKPQIRFVDIGRDDNSKFFNEDAAEKLRETYKNSVDGKNVLVVDEYSLSGGTLANARRVFESNFPEGEFTYTSVLDNRPPWYGETKYIGVVESGWLRQFGNRDEVPDTYISTTYSKAANDPAYEDIRDTIKDDATDSRKKANDFRKGLTLFSKHIAKHCTKIDPNPYNKPEPFLPEKA